MVLDSGSVTICRGVNSASAGSMPSMVMEDIYTSYYGEKRVGFARYFTAKEHGSRADMLIEIQRNGDIRTSDEAVLTSFYDNGTSGTYRIVQVQHVVDGDGQQMTDLTLERIDNLDP